MISGLQSPTNGSHADAGATWLIRPCPDNRASRFGSVGETSMDQLVARVVGEETPFASLELISRSEGSHSRSLLRSNISWRNATTPVPRESNPQAIYDRLTGADTEETEGSDSRRRSTLDAVLEDLGRITKRVGFFTINTGPAFKTLPDGRNAHLIQKPTSWWLPRLCEHFEIAHLQGEPQGFWVVTEKKLQV